MGRKKRVGEASNAQQDELSAAASELGAQNAAASAEPAPPTVELPPGVKALPASHASTLQTMMAANPALAAQLGKNPFLAVQVSQLARAASATTGLPGVTGEVQEFADHFNLDDRITKQLDEELKLRPDTFDGDLIALWDILETARNPAGLLSVKIKEMQDGIFVGQPKVDKDIKDMQKKYRLDDQATRKLAEALQNRPNTRKEDIELIHKHLETSNKPSARIMMMLGKLRSGDPLGEPDKRVAPGSYLDRVEREKKEKEEEKRNDRRGGRRSRSRSRDRGRGRSRSRDRRRSRSRDRR